MGKSKAAVLQSEWAGGRSGTELENLLNLFLMQVGINPALLPKPKIWNLNSPGALLNGDLDSVLPQAPAGRRTSDELTKGGQTDVGRFFCLEPGVNEEKKKKKKKKCCSFSARMLSRFWANGACTDSIAGE